MRTVSIRTRLLLSYFGIITALGGFTILLALYIMNKDIVGRAQAQVVADLHAARSVYENKLEMLRKGFEFASLGGDMAEIKSKLGLDYLYVVEKARQDSARSEIVQNAFRGDGTVGTRVISEEEMATMPSNLQQLATIAIEYTPHARPCSTKTLKKALAVEYAKPFFDPDGRITYVMYGGKIMSRRLEFIDRVHKFVYEDRFYKSKPVGTITIFLDDVRIATNVLNHSGTRAIGTRVSKVVYENVIGKGLTWIDRAFVVTDWYLAAYEPIVNIHGDRVGILYVGLLEQQFTDMIRRNIFGFVTITCLGIVFASIFSFWLAAAISRPVTGLLFATERLAGGDLSHRIGSGMKIKEMDRLARAFNAMADKVKQRDESLRIANEHLDALNKSYLDLVGMVSHELKGVLASAVMNTYSVKDGYLGEINEPQKEAMTSIAKNLDYLTVTVKRFLDLSRIEKGELEVHATDVRLKEHVFDPTIEAFARQSAEKRITIRTTVQPEITIRADRDLMLIVAGNLISNAIKYGREGGLIEIAAELEAGNCRIRVYNEGAPIPGDQIVNLFKKFSRLRTEASHNVRGTGLGLFITKEIVEKHGGAIVVEPCADGNAFIITIPEQSTTMR
jgi:two-component system NtrC family sensor kinase